MSGKKTPILPDPKPGARFTWGSGEVRIMAVVDGWMMVRRPRAIPFVLSVGEYHVANAPEETQ